MHIKPAAKRIADSYVEQAQIVQPIHGNSFGQLFGGQLLAWIDVVANIVARRHSNCYTNTVHISDLNFKAPAYVADLVVLCGRLVYVGTTSMEVCVETYVESKCGERKLINKAYVVMTPMAEEDRTQPVPQLILETAKQKADWQAGEIRYLRRKAGNL